MPSADPQPLDLDVTATRERFRLEAAFRVRAGSVSAVIGPNGAGKTTLLDALAGLVPLDAGAIQLGDRVLDDVAAGVHVPAGARRTASAFQHGLLFDGISVLDNVAFGRRARGESVAEARRHARQVLDELGLGERADDRPGALSGGMAARVGLARALAVEPDLLLLDEPLAALDVDGRVELRAWLGELLAARPVTTVLVTHEPADVRVLADQVVVVEGGRVTARCTPDGLASCGSAFAGRFAEA